MARRRFAAGNDRRARSEHSPAVSRKSTPHADDFRARYRPPRDCICRRIIPDDPRQCVCCRCASTHARQLTLDQTSSYGTRIELTPPSGITSRPKSTTSSGRYCHLRVEPARSKIASSGYAIVPSAAVCRTRFIRCETSESGSWFVCSPKIGSHAPSTSPHWYAAMYAAEESHHRERGDWNLLAPPGRVQVHGGAATFRTPSGSGICAAPAEFR
jgi:hypothetical protein